LRLRIASFGLHIGLPLFYLAERKQRSGNREKHKCKIQARQRDSKKRVVDKENRKQEKEK
jgi:hypothetical protein